MARLRALAPGPAEITVDATAGGILLLAANPARRVALIQNTGNAPMRVGVGQNPTAVLGFVVVAGGVFEVTSTDVVKGFRTTATSTTVFVQEFGSN